MQDEATPDADDAPSFSDPESLREREDVDFLESTRVHEDEDHCAVGVEGQAVVGVTNDDEVLVLVHDEFGPGLPNGAVESGDDWAAVGRERVEHLMDLSVEIDGPERVRKIEHLVEGDDEPHTTSYLVVFRASPAADADPSDVTDGCDWHAEWIDALPESDDDGALEDDIRLFVG